MPSYKEIFGASSRSRVARRTAIQRILFLIIFVIGLGLLAYSRINKDFSTSLKTGFYDLAAPVINTLMEPVYFASSVGEEAKNLVDLREENTRLAKENLKLQYYKSQVSRLRTENTELRKLLSFVPDAPSKSIAARVIATSSSSFVKSVLINAGQRQGISNGDSAIYNEALIGRVVETGKNSARVLLLTDISSRIPVMIEGTRDRAILAGNNTASPPLKYLSATNNVEIGQLVITSGHGGIFPAGLMIGHVSKISEKNVQVKLIANPDSVDYVRIFNFGLNGVIDLKK